MSVTYQEYIQYPGNNTYNTKRAGNQGKSTATWDESGHLCDPSTRKEKKYGIGHQKIL